MLGNSSKATIIQSQTPLQIKTWVNEFLFAIIAIAVMMVIMPSTKVSAAPLATIVRIEGSARPPGFSPPFRTIYVNTQITFINDSYPPTSYTIFAKDDSFSSPTIAPSQQWTVTLPTTGNHEYTTKEAPTHMQGVLIVVDASATLIPTPDPTAQAAFVNHIKNGGGTQSPSSPPPSRIPAWAFIILAAFVIGCLAGVAILLRTRFKHSNS